ncbi:HRDC domain-containing protein [Marinobacter sp. 71-i]|uniref:HRDC domain-containing protein n=1 Tax=Marinobacter iranensis TaxID=2962607 RepID=A0ABT5Y9T6_9GAMM|nr:HRDC domain-containing protein [Marinobacter iranensis]MDF0750442.1 HRDC domain-containing protein [Marinobacter iranensis]
MDSNNPAAVVPAASETVTWIREPGDLDHWIAQGKGQPLALDTEFERVNTFFPIPGLVQLGLGENFCLVDPSVAESSQGFRQLLTDPDVPKLLYAMSEDLELFRHWLQLDPEGVLDLQIGAALAGAGFSVGYARLVETLFGESLDKSATRSDWVSRPLSQAQERYALDDIRFLVPMYHWVIARLRERGLETALADESARFSKELASQDNPDTHYLKLRGGWTLSRQQQGVLKDLVRWRENESRLRNRPRNRVVADPLLIAIAQKLPGSVRELSNIQGLPSPVVRRYGETIIEMVANASTADNSGIETIAPPLSRQDQMFYKQLKRHMIHAAEARDIPVELLAPRKRLEAVVQHRNLAAGLFEEGWRRETLEPVREPIEELLKS